MSRHLLAASGLSLFLLACAGTETDNPGAPEGVELARSPQAYVKNPKLDDSEFEALQEGNRSFAMEFYQMLRQEAEPDQNLMTSPLSISMLMAMTYAGASGDTAAQIAAALHFDAALESLHPSMNQLSQRLRESTAKGSAKLTLLNSLWVDQGLADRSEIGTEFLDTLSTQYDTGLFLADFASHAEQTRDAINDWVSQNTDGTIPELFAPRSFDSTTSLVLSNTIYFKAPWEYGFDREKTLEQPFTLPNGAQVSVPMMNRSEAFPFVFDTDWSAAELPYASSSLSMILVLPNQGDFETFEATLDAARVEEITLALDEARQVDETLSLALPRFSFDTDINLIPPLQGLGISDAFSDFDADFSGVFPTHDVYVGTALQKTRIDVDEKGTVAAAASGVVLVSKGTNPALTFDRPFLFFIYDRGTETVLFVGRFTNPQ